MTEIIVAVVGDVGVAVDLVNAGEDIPQTVRQFKAGLAAVFADDELTDPLPVADGERFFHELAAHFVIVEISRRAEHGKFHQHFAHVLELVDHAKDIRAAGHEPQAAVFMRDEGGELVKILPAPVILIVFRDFQQPLLRPDRLDVLHKAAVLTAIAGVLEFHELSFSARRTDCHFHYLLIVDKKVKRMECQHLTYSDESRRFSTILLQFTRFVEKFFVGFCVSAVFFPFFPSTYSLPHFSKEKITQVD